MSNRANIFTGKRPSEFFKSGAENRAENSYTIGKYGEIYPYGFVEEVGAPHRYGEISITLGDFNLLNNSQKIYFKVGLNSQKFLQWIQTIVLHSLKPEGGFRMTNNDIYPILEIKYESNSSSEYSLWGSTGKIVPIKEA